MRLNNLYKNHTIWVWQSQDLNSGVTYSKAHVSSGTTDLPHPASRIPEGSAGGSTALPTLWRQTSDLDGCVTVNVCCSKHPFVQQPWEMNAPTWPRTSTPRCLTRRNESMELHRRLVLIWPWQLFLWYPQTRYNPVSHSKEMHMQIVLDNGMLPSNEEEWTMHEWV